MSVLVKRRKEGREETDREGKRKGEEKAVARTSFYFRPSPLPLTHTYCVSHDTRHSVVHTYIYIFVQLKDIYTCIHTLSLMKEQWPSYDAPIIHNQ